MSNSNDYVLVWDTGIRRPHERYADTSDGRITWTPHLTNPKPVKGKPRIVHDRIATIMTFAQACRLKWIFCNPGLVMIRKAA